MCRYSKFDISSDILPKIAIGQSVTEHSRIISLFSFYRIRMILVVRTVTFYILEVVMISVDFFSHKNICYCLVNVDLLSF